MTEGAMRTRFAIGALSLLTVLGPTLARLDGLLDALAAETRQAADDRRRGRPLGPISGFPSLDRELGGAFSPGIHILGAVPGLGKTALALQIARQLMMASADSIQGISRSWPISRPARCSAKARAWPMASTSRADWILPTEMPKTPGTATAATSSLNQGVPGPS